MFRFAFITETFQELTHSGFNVSRFILSLRFMTSAKHCSIFYSSVNDFDNRVESTYSFKRRPAKKSIDEYFTLFLLILAMPCLCIRLVL